jgi:hypothetical protein
MWSKVKSFAGKTEGVVVLTLLAVYLAEKQLGTNLAGIPSALRARVRL